MKKRIISKNPSARIAGRLIQGLAVSLDNHPLTFVRGVCTIVAVVAALVAVAEDVFCEIPVVFRV